MAKSTFRSDVEGLRGIAILLVVAYHAGLPPFSGGYVGVDVFFVLSGYLITGLLIGEVESTGRLDLVQFYARRVRRLLPASAVVLLTCVLVGWFIYAPFEQHRLAASAVATASYLSNVWFATVATNYLAADPHGNPLLHTWSLAVEEQFYVVWPTLILLAARAGTGGGDGRRRWAVCMIVVAVVSLAAGFWLTGVAQPWAFFSMPARAWEFAIGGLARLVPPAIVAARRGAEGALGWTGAAAVLAAGVLFDDATPFPGAAALVPVLGTAALLVAGAGGADTPVARVLDARPTQWFGRLSYSWYLWHWPALVFALDVFGPLTLPQRVASAVVALALAAATFALVESPVRLSRRLAPRPRLSVALGAALTVVSIVVAGSWRGVAIRAEGSAEQRRFTEASLDRPIVSSNGCHANSYIQTIVRDCVFGDTTARTTIVLFGDSHAEHWFPALDALARERRWKLVSYTKSGCPAASVSVFNAALGRDYVECDQWRETVLRRIRALRPDAVFLGSARIYVTGGPRMTAAHLVSADAWLAGTRLTLARLSGVGIRPVLVRDTPRPGFEVPGCLARSAWRGWGEDCAVTRLAALDTVVYALERRAADGMRDVALLDLTDRICDGVSCAPQRDGVIVYSDADHLTARFSTSLAPALGRELQRLAVLAATPPADDVTPVTSAAHRAPAASAHARAQPAGAPSSPE